MFPKIIKSIRINLRLLSRKVVIFFMRQPVWESAGSIAHDKSKSLIRLIGHFVDVAGFSSCFINALIKRAYPGNS